jgi:hypothetical protein
VETAGWEGRGVICGKPAPRRLYPLLVSVKDRWVGTREQVLNVSKWSYDTSPGTATRAARGGLLIGGTKALNAQGVSYEGTRWS